MKLLIFSHREEPRDIWLICPSICLILNSTLPPPPAILQKDHITILLCENNNVPAEGTRPHFLQTLSACSVAVRNWGRVQDREDSGILTMVMWNEGDSFPASILMMLSIFLVILKLTKTWILVTISFNISAYMCTLLVNVEHGLYHTQPRNRVWRMWERTQRKRFSIEWDASGSNVICRCCLANCTGWVM